MHLLHSNLFIITCYPPHLHYKTNTPHSIAVIVRLMAIRQSLGIFPSVLRTKCEHKKRLKRSSHKSFRQMSLFLRLWRRERDLNPRAGTTDLLVFEARPFSHLGISPQRVYFSIIKTHKQGFKEKSEDICTSVMPYLSAAYMAPLLQHIFITF